MDRQTIAQAVAALVMLAALVRWLPPGDSDDALGRGDPWKLLAAVQQQAAAPDSDEPAARLRTNVGAGNPMRLKKTVEHWGELLALERELRARAAPGDVVQVRNMARNDLWAVTADLYPLRVVGKSLEEGSDRAAPILAEADWVLTGCALKGHCTVQAASDARGGGP